MAKRRLNQEQKCWGVSITLFNSTYPMSAYELGKKLGFSNGQPLKKIIDHLLRENWLSFEVYQTRLQKPARYYFLTKEAREALQSRGWE